MGIMEKMEATIMGFIGLGITGLRGSESWGYTGYNTGLYCYNGKENGNCYLGFLDSGL